MESDPMLRGGAPPIGEADRVDARSRLGVGGGAERQFAADRRDPQNTPRRGLPNALRMVTPYECLNARREICRAIGCECHGDIT